MKLKLISSTLFLSLFLALVTTLNFKSYAEPLIPEDLLQNKTFLDTDTKKDDQAPYSPFNSNWKRLTLLHTFDKQNAPVFNLTFNPQGNLLLSAGGNNDPVIHYWAIGSGKQIDSRRGHATAITGLAYSADGSTLVTTAQGTGVSIWNGPDHEYKSTFLVHANTILALAITPDSDTLVTGGLDGIKVWNLKYQRPIYTLISVGHPCYALAMHPNGYVIASGNKEGKVTLWNLRTAKQISEFSPHDKEINGLIFTQDGNKLITSSSEKTVKVWDIKTGNLIREFSGHQDRLRTIALSPDGKTLASGGNDGVRIWDFNTGELLALLPSINDWVQSLAFSPDSTMLAVGSFSRQIQLWQAKVGDPVVTQK